ncbi:hypothetical protein ADL22_22640 [Streptomyces sp. NRRL F-4489]|uniref:hypothetical protein n=1 Tax=Streptomyces sp. NRRL F-4489 TaxID=1609095 RepID=UPI000749659B|nr:hypothetical protein [Streptomyces sp. NRRL F-4489]KUL37191.1 hypothetical protein ADL22_22640 [Streptomyces sp. NRRL F-4489]
MSSATMSSASVHAATRRPAKGAPARGPAGARPHRPAVGGALRAVKIFAAAAFSVVVMGEYADG